MNKLERIIDMTEHPERYADDDFCHISGNNGPISDEDIDHEWQRLMTSRRQLRHARLRWAALFIGVLFVSSLVYALILKTAPSPSLKAESMTDSVPPAMKAEQTADEKIYTIKLNVIDPLSEGEAISGHPTEVSNRRAAETELIPFLENIMNWQELPEEPAQDTIAVVDEIITDEEVTDEDLTDEIEKTATLEEDISNSIPETVEIISSENQNSDEDSLKPDSLAFKILMGMAVFTVFGGIILLAKLRK